KHFAVQMGPFAAIQTALQALCRAMRAAGRGEFRNRRTYRQTHPGNNPVHQAQSLAVSLDTEAHVEEIAVGRARNVVPCRRTCAARATGAVAEASAARLVQTAHMMDVALRLR